MVPNPDHRNHQTRSRRRWAPVAAVLAALVLLSAAACGSDDDSSSGGGGGGGGGSTPSGGGEEPAGDPIHIFQIVTIDNPNLTFPEVLAGTNAAVAAINAAGGIDGRPLEMTTCDDHGDPAEAAACAREAVDSDAVAVVSPFNLQGSQILPILEAAGMAYVAPNPILPEDSTSPVSFLLDGGTLTAYMGQAPHMAALIGAETAALAFSDTPARTANEALMRTGAEMAGIEVVGTVTIPANATDVSPYVSQLAGESPDVILTATTSGDQTKLWLAMQSQGVDIPVAASLGALTAAAIEAAGGAADGTYGVSQFPDPQGDVAGVPDYRADMEAHEPDAQLEALSMRAWAGIQLFAQVAAGLDEIDRTSVLDALTSLNGLDFAWYEGLSFDQDGPFPDTPRIVVTAAYISKIEDGVPVGAGDPIVLEP